MIGCAYTSCHNRVVDALKQKRNSLGFFPPLRGERICSTQNTQHAFHLKQTEAGFDVSNIINLSQKQHGLFIFFLRNGNSEEFSYLFGSFQISLSHKKGTIHFEGKNRKDSNLKKSDFVDMNSQLNLQADSDEACQAPLEILDALNIGLKKN